MFKAKMKKGFTIIELVIVIIIIATLAAIIIPTFMGQVEQAKIAAIKANVESIRAAARLYYSEKNTHWPKKIADMVGTNSDSCYLRVFPEESLTPKSAEKNSGGTDGLGGWYFEFRGDTQPPIIFVNLHGVDKNGKAFSTY